ncbi:MAG: cupredoxin domain-containing protein [Gemmatimonadales bacterium]|nr:cupredoxin domain-containing protein [Gemmatimonadales bacterium]NIN12091.1 cupredoxin domain-containing protein [Gemmatimonadales bacterium]NIR03326.1 cupredoxin domain-containing protein [Gemmatimonadales bacterium]NIS67006.1 cupredoxin domain-containing protein [Gemmatimonadales bacterium]
MVDALGLASISAVVWYFWLSRRQGVRANVAHGVQSALIVVKGGYTPDTIVLERSRPTRLVFRREESAPCSERVVLPAFDCGALLPEGEEVPIEFVPMERGEFVFTCHLGVLRGRIVVE